jgi:hypothetical protein
LRELRIGWPPALYEGERRRAYRRRARSRRLGALLQRPRQLHVVNTQRARAIKASFQIGGRKVQSGRVYEIADDPTVEVTLLNSADVMRIMERPMPDVTAWEFPAASVSVIEFKLA